jgi:hypothetical protein
LVGDENLEGFFYAVNGSEEERFGFRDFLIFVLGKKTVEIKKGRTVMSDPSSFEKEN